MNWIKYITGIILKFLYHSTEPEIKLLLIETNNESYREMNFIQYSTLTIFSVNLIIKISNFKSL
jgi:hypothetical protein